MGKEQIIDVKTADVTGDNLEDLVILKGKYIGEDSNYIKELTLIVQDSKEGKQYTLDIENGGYDVGMYIGDFNDDEKSEILIYGQTGGSGDYAIGKVYEFIEGNFRVIFNVDNYSDEYGYEGKYLNNYLLEITSLKQKESFTFYIGGILKDYLDAIYDKDGIVKTSQIPTVSYVNTINPITNLQENSIGLLVRQKIIGVNNASLLGFMETTISLRNNIINIENQNGVIVKNRIEENNSKESTLANIKKNIGSNIEFINIDKFGGTNNLLKVDLDNDGNDEVVCAFKENDRAAIAIFREESEKLVLLDTLVGDGFDVADLYIKEIKQKTLKNIIIGWKVAGMWANLQVLELKQNKLKQSIREDKIPYSKVEIKPLDKDKNGINEIILWSHDTGEAYEVKILTCKGDNLHRTYKYDKEYFNKVENYYKSLIKRTRETAAYLYYLADAQYRAGHKVDASITVEKAMKSSKPYPSMDELKKLKKRINS